MNGMRKWACLFAGVAFAAFALPSSAQTKIFTLSAKVYTNDATPVVSQVIPSGSTAIVVLDFLNATPNGNSVFNSVKVNIPADVQYSTAQASVTKNSGSCPAPAHTTSTPTSGPGGTLQLNGINGAKPGGHFCVYLAVTSISNACAPSIWTGFANTGNSFNGTAFVDANTQDPSGASKTQTIDGCEGTLACGQTVGDTDPVLDGDPSKAITRGILNTDQTCSALIGYSLNLDVSDINNQITTFVTFKNGQAFAVEYVLAWAPVPLSQVDDIDTSTGLHTGNHTGLPNFVPRVAWLQDGGNYVPLVGQACKGTDVSDPTIMPTLPAVVPAPYVGSTPAKMCIAGVEWQLQSDGTIQYLVRVIDQTDSRTFGP